MSDASSLKISVSGVRGIVGAGLTAPMVCRFASALGTWAKGGTVALGRDPRPSGGMFFQAAAAGLRGVGCHVVDLGIVPVPTVGLAVERLKAQAGLMITASHNPIEWNGMKFIHPDGRFLTDAEGQDVIARFESDDFRAVAYNQLGTVREERSAAAWHGEAVCELVDVQAIKSRRFKVVIDSCNGAGSELAPSLLKRLGCQVIPLNITPDGTFPRPPEPLPQHLRQLCDAVKAHGADVGFAQDADADRLAIVSNEGVAIGEEYTLALAVERVLQQTPGPVAVNLSTSRMTEDVASRYGVPTFRTKVGEVNVVGGMTAHRAVIGGEGNGGVIHPKLHYMRDSFVAMAVVLELLAIRRQPLSSIVAAFPKYVMRKRAVHCPLAQIQEALRLAEQAYPDAEIDRQDGVRITLADGWIHVRGSNTEPLLRVIVEAPTEASVNTYYQRIAEMLHLEPLLKEA